ncbi:MAG: tetratricopeptide repeat protein [Limisphaerales bacterium]
MARSALPVWLMAALLVLVTIALYWPVMRHDFVNYDDTMYVTANVRVQNGLTLENLKWACCNPVSLNWHPLTVWSHMADCQLFGLKPWGHHLTSVLLHALNTVLVFLWLRSLTGAFWRSALVAALFGLHPLHVESVAWVAERKDVLSTCFGLLSLIFYARYGRKGWAVKDRDIKARGVPAPRRLDYLLALICFALGLMSKPMLVTWPFVMFLLDYWPLERFKTSDAWRLVTEKVPFFALAAAVSVVTFVVQKRGGAVVTAEAMPLGGRCGNALISYCRYLGKLFWPTDLAIFYPHPGQWPLAKVLLAGVLIAGISVLVFVRRRRYPFLLVGWLWFCGTLVPVIGLVQMGRQAMADRYTYIPSLGVLVLAVWGVYELTKSWHYRVVAWSVAGSTVVVLCLALTRQQLGYWKDSEVLFRHALEVTEDNYLAHLSLGSALNEKDQIDEAIREFQEAIRLKPDYALAHSNLGIALNRKGQIDEGISQYREAIRLKPDYAEAHKNLGMALVKKGQIDEAIREFQKAIRVKPDYDEAHNNLGMALVRKGQTDEAIREFQEAIRLKPDYAEACNNLGIALVSKGQIDEGISQYQKAIRLKTDYALAHSNLGIALVRKGQIDEAIREFQEAIRLKPDFAEAHHNLTKALEMKNAPAGR